jgi:menaquinone-specific isochorismate synthase
MIAITRPLTADVDLNSVCRGDGMLFVRDGVGVAGRGELARVPEREALQLLQSITHIGDIASPGSGPLLFGIVPFHPEEEATFILPRVLIAKSSDGVHSITVIGETEEHCNDAAFDAALHDAMNWPPSIPTVNSYAITQGVDISTYLDAVTKARTAVRNGDLTKAVIARDIIVQSSHAFDVHGILLRLRNTYGSSYRYFIDGLLGASPELLLEVEGRRVRSHPLAGTVPRTGDPTRDAQLAESLVASTKNQVEHRVVIDMVHDTLLPHCSYLDWEPEPSIVSVANVQHLGTAVEGQLTEPTPPVMTLVRSLCPTPALGGHPSKEAIDFIVNNEGMTRGNYGGAVGWIDARGNGTWAVTIRCAELSRDMRTARLCAGGGIVAESDPLAELAETQAKFQAMLSAIVRP